MDMLVSARFILGMPFCGDAAGTNLAGGGFAITGSRPHGARGRAARLCGGAACQMKRVSPGLMARECAFKHVRPAIRGARRRHFGDARDAGPTPGQTSAMTTIQHEGGIQAPQSSRERI